jgi:hypothetical protein
MLLSISHLERPPSERGSLVKLYNFLRAPMCKKANLKVVTIEKQGGPGSWQMIDIGPGPW